MTRPDIPVLTTLRFPAAIAIVLYHFLAYTTTPSWIWDGFNSGVTFFYVLSGFILYYNYSNLKDRGFFWVARFARIWPLHVATLILIVIALPWDRILGHASWPYTLPLNVSLLQAWLPIKGSALSYNGVSWSLSVEAFFYASFPFLLIAMNRRGPALPLIVSFLLGLGIVVAVMHKWPNNADFVSSLNPLCRVFEFIVGMTACRIWLTRRGGEKSVALWSGCEFLTMALCLALVIGIPAALNSFAISNPATAWVGAAICAAAFAVMTWVYAHQAGIISRLLSARWMTWLGEISFASYMCHQIILRRFFEEDLAKHNSGIWGPFAIYMVLTLVVSALLFHFVETPSRHAIVGAYKSYRKGRAGK